jgi:DNA (cytosine-5)-methyltransferase 3A
MKVLSLFDGMSCGQQALERAGIDVDTYYASEIDKYAIQVTMANYPNTIQLGSVVDIDVKSLCLSEVYSYLCTYDTNLQSKFSEQEVLYWINEEYTISANFGTQKQNEGQALRQHSILQCFEEIRFTKCGMGSFIKTRNIKGCGVDGDKADIGNSVKLQCGEWWYGDDIQSRNTQTDIRRAKREAENGNLQEEDIRNPESKISRRKRTQVDFRENEKCNVDKASKGELFAGAQENKLSGKVAEEEGNGGVETDRIIENLIRELHKWNETNGTSEIYRDFLRLYSQEQITVVKYAGGLKIFKGKFDLVCGGSPCQSFSFAGKRKGMSTKDEQEILTLEHYLKLKSEGYEFEGQSYLFWEYMRILQELRVKNPNVLFLLENVEMGAKWEKVLSNAIGVRGIHINSALVSAQNRKRIYWINWGMKPMGLFGDMESIIEQPKDRGILLKDILESEVDEKYFLSEKFDNWLNKHSKKTGNEYKKTEGNRKAGCLSVSALKSVNLSADFILDNKQIIVHNTQRRDPNRPSIQKNKNAGGSGHLSRNDGKTYSLDTCNTNAVEIVALTEVRTEEAKQIRRETGTNPKRAKELVERTDGKIGAILTSQTPDNLVKITNAMEIREVKQINPSLESGGKQPYQQNRVYDINGISPALMQGKSDLLITSGTLRTHKDGEGFREVHSGKGATVPARAREDGSGQNVVKLNSRIRRLTPIECERLQTVADNYTAYVSDSQRYKMLGNGWTIEVISYLFKHI